MIKNHHDWIVNIATELGYRYNSVEILYEFSLKKSLNKDLIKNSLKN